MNLDWDGVAGAAGYTLHYGETSGNYTNTKEVGNVTSYTLAGLLENRIYCITATAYDAARRTMSGYSNEVCATVPRSTADSSVDVGTAGAAASTGSGYQGSEKTEMVSAPKAHFTVSRSSGTAPLTVAFTDASTGEITSRCWDFVVEDGTDCVAGGGGNGGQAVQEYKAPGNYTVRMTVTGPGGSDMAEDIISVAAPTQVAAFSAIPAPGGSDTHSEVDYITVSLDDSAPASPGDFYQQEDGASGLAVMEAEWFTDIVSLLDHDWVAITHPVGYAGDGAMLAWPDDGARIDKTYFTDSPRLDFTVNFVRSGTHYVWLRGLATGNDNSAHVGLNGQDVSSAGRVEFAPNGDWDWTNDTVDNVRATIDVPAPGEHSINVWMRQSGLRLDRILLTTDANYLPSDGGPAVTWPSGGIAASTDSNASLITP